MSGYRQSSFDPDAGSPTNTARKGSWWKILLSSLAYMVPLFWLWDRTDYPDSLGVHVTAHGRAGLAESWYYSYLLLERHHVLDVITFIYMWSIIIGIIAWVAFKKLWKTKFSLYSRPDGTRVHDVKIIGPLADRAALPSFTPSEWVLLSLLGVVLLLGLVWALDFHPNFSGVFTSESTVRSRCFNEKGSYVQSDVALACEQLLEDSTIAIRAQPNDPTGYFNRGYAYEHMGDLNRAVGDFSQVIRLTPDSADAYYYRWAAYKDLGEDDQAAADFAALSRINPQLAANIRSIR